MFETKDSGVREEFASGMVRDTEAGKPRFDLLLPLGVPYHEQMLTRLADLMARGAEKYGDRNWEKASGEEELRRYFSSAMRHLMQYINGEEDEDHAAAVMYNVLAAATVQFKMRGADIVPLPLAPIGDPDDTPFTWDEEQDTYGQPDGDFGDVCGTFNGKQNCLRRRHHIGFHTQDGMVYWR